MNHVIDNVPADWPSTDTDMAYSIEVYTTLQSIISSFFKICFQNHG